MTKFKERSMKNKLEIVKITVYYKLFADMCVVKPALKYSACRYGILL